MPSGSILDKVVANENSCTELLRNLMVRSDTFRRRVLNALFPQAEWTARIGPNQIDTQILLPDCGVPDIVIRTPELFAIVECKFNLRCGLTSNQRKRYIGYLIRGKEPDRRLVFLIPRRWIHREDLEKCVIAPKCPPRVQAKVVLWEEVLPVLHEIANGATADPVAPFVTEFYKLLDDRFGPIKFSEEEISMLLSIKDFSTDFYAMRKVQFVIEKIADYQKRNYKLDWEREKESYGFYFKQGKDDLLWFGIWRTALKVDGAHQLCIAVDRSWGREVTEAFLEVCKKEKKKLVDIEEGGKWIVTWISDEFLQSNDSDGQVWKELKPILEAVSKASRTSSGR